LHRKTAGQPSWQFNLVHKLKEVKTVFNGTEMKEMEQMYCRVKKKTKKNPENRRLWER